MSVINKDILTIDEGYILHQVNCRGVMGAGLALQIARKWPVVLQEYRERCKRGTPETLLGTYSTTRCGDICIVNLFGQRDFGTKKRETDYEALATAIHSFFNDAEPRLPVYVPWKIGCGLGGGNWDVVQAMFFGRDVTYCRYSP